MEIRKLNTLRALAAFIVVASHYGNSNASTHWGALIGNGAGQLGVMLFFILSGFLMSHLYLGKDYEGSRARNFLIARAARVLPLFVAVVLVSYAFDKLGFTGIFYSVHNFASLVSHLALLSGTDVLWTIAPEIQFYLLFVPLWMLHTMRSAYLYAVMVLVIAALVALQFPNPIWGNRGYIVDTKILLALPYFFVGMALGRLYVHREAFRRLQSNWYLLALPVIFVLYPTVFERLFGAEHGMWEDLGVLIAVGFAFLCLVFMVPDDSPVLANPIGDFVGKVSYSWYLLHLPVLVLINQYAYPYPLLALPVFIVVSLLVAYAAYLFLESPSRRAIRKLIG